MNELPFWKEVLGYGVGGILASIMFWFYTKRETEHKEFVTQCLHQSNKQNDVLVTVVKENTSAMTKNSTVVEALHRRLDGELRNREESSH